MPEAPGPAENPNEDKKLTPEQQGLLARIWYEVISDQGLARYLQQMAIMRDQLTPEEARRLQEHYDSELPDDATDEQRLSYWAKVAKSQGLGYEAGQRGGRGNFGPYAFPQPTVGTGPDGRPYGTVPPTGRGGDLDTAGTDPNPDLYPDLPQADGGDGVPGGGVAPASDMHRLAADVFEQFYGGGRTRAI